MAGLGKERLALDLSLYSEGSEEVLAYDLASYTREMARRRVGEGTIKKENVELDVTPFHWYKTEEGVFCPEYGNKEILHYCSGIDEKSRIETSAVKYLRKTFVEQINPWMAVWFSPPNKMYGYSAARAVVMMSLNNQRVEAYGLCLGESAELMRDKANQFGMLNQKRPLWFNQPEEIRGRPIVVDLKRGQSPWEVLEGQIPGWQPIWEAIKSGKVQEAYQRTLIDTREAAQEALRRGKYGGNLVQRAAGVERYLEGRGYRFAEVSDCGFSGKYLLDRGKDSVYQGNYRSGYDNGNNVLGLGAWMLGRMETTRDKKRIFNCGVCKRELNEVDGDGNKRRGLMMKAGDKCPHCKETYLGC